MLKTIVLFAMGFIVLSCGMALVLVLAGEAFLPALKFCAAVTIGSTILWCGCWCLCSLALDRM